MKTSIQDYIDEDSEYAPNFRLAIEKLNAIDWAGSKLYITGLLTALGDMSKHMDEEGQAKGLALLKSAITYTEQRDKKEAPLLEIPEQLLDAKTYLKTPSARQARFQEAYKAGIDFDLDEGGKLSHTLFFSGVLLGIRAMIEVMEIDDGRGAEAWEPLVQSIVALGK